MKRTGDLSCISQSCFHISSSTAVSVYITNILLASYGNKHPAFMGFSLFCVNTSLFMMSFTVRNIVNLIHSDFGVEGI